MEIKFLTKEELMDNASKFCDLYHSRFTAEIDKDIVINRFVKNPYNEIFVCVVEDNGAYVANSSALPTRLSYRGRIFKSALSVNMMTHPDYSGKGLIQETVGALNKKLKGEGYKLIYGFPNYLSNSLLNVKFGRKDVYEYPTLEKKVSLGNKVRNVHFCEVDDIQDYQSNRIRIVKDSEYVEWRYSKFSSLKYYYAKSDLGSWLVFKVFQDIVNIVEFHPVQLSEIVDLISFVEDYASLNKLSRITIWSMINTDEHCCLEKIGFRNQYPITYFSVLDLGLSDDIDVDIYDHRNWKINMGDDNVY